MKSKRLFKKLLAIILALCFLPNAAALAVDYNLLTPDGDLTMLEPGDLVLEGDTITDTNADDLTLNYYDEFLGPLLDSFTVASPHTVLGAADVSATVPDGDYKFAGWFVYNVEPGASSSLDLVPYWASAYRITYDLNGGDGALPVDSNLYLAGEAVPLNNGSGLSRPGYLFLGWAPDPESTEALTSFIMDPDMNILYAVWTPRPSSRSTSYYTLSYDGNGAFSGTVPASQSCAEGSTVTVSGNIGALSKSGYRFMGWNSKPDGSGTAYAGGDTLTIGSSNVVLYAQWEKIKIVYDKRKWKGYNNYNVAYSTSDGKNTIVPTSYYYAPSDSILYKTPKQGTYAAMYSFVDFDDITDSHWASQFIWFLSARKIVCGGDNGLFNPEGIITRAQFITILARMTPGLDLTSVPSAGFLDVPPDAWYAPYIDWGYENRIIFGYGNGCFGPNDPITREQLCRLIGRYCQYLGYELGEINTSVTFQDQDSISPWALGYVDTLQKAGLIEDDDTHTFRPLASSTRAQAVSITCRLLMGILEAMIDPDSIPCN